MDVYFIRYQSVRVPFDNGYLKFSFELRLGVGGMSVVLYCFDNSYYITTML